MHSIFKRNSYNSLLIQYPAPMLQLQVTSRNESVSYECVNESGVSSKIIKSQQSETSQAQVIRFDLKSYDLGGGTGKTVFVSKNAEYYETDIAKLCHPLCND